MATTPPRAELAAQMALRPGHDVRTTADLLASMTERPAWQTDAACRGMGHALFFPTMGRSPAPAKAVCARCTVANECRSYAMETGADSGVWGGMGGMELFKAHRAAA